MSKIERVPGSREEDAWLSDEQLEQCAPAETEPFDAAVPTRMVSNGAYTPHTQTDKQKQVEARVKEIATKAAKKLGITRRQFLETTGGMAASFMAMNEVFGANFQVGEAELFEPEAHDENGPPKNLFVFDDQTHIVRSTNNGPNGLRALAQGPGSVSTGAGYTSNPSTATGGNRKDVDELGSSGTHGTPAQLAPVSRATPGPAT